MSHNKRDVHRLAVILIKYIPAVALREALAEMASTADCMVDGKLIRETIKVVERRLDGKAS